MSAIEPPGNESNEEYSDDPEQPDKRSYKLLKVEYEKCRQENYHLKRKLELSEAMLREVQEANDTLERCMDQRVAKTEQMIADVEEKHRVALQEYENTVSRLETQLAERANDVEELRKGLVESRARAENVALRSRVDELLAIQSEDREKLERALETTEEWKSRCDEYERYGRSLKEQLSEKERALDDVRAEVASMRAEAAALEAQPARDAEKGNSLFAEVEDRRRNVVGRMNMLREKYSELKRVCKSQMAEIKTLRAERVATLRKWENETGDTLTESEELMQKYRGRIADLESKLNSEIKKNAGDTKEANSTNPTTFGYFQSLLDARKKETDDLRIQVESLRTKLLVQEETKISVNKQLQYWRYKASSLEAQACTLQAESKFETMADVEKKILNDIDESPPASDTGPTSPLANLSERDTRDRRSRNEKSVKDVASDLSSCPRETTCKIKEDEKVAETGVESKRPNKLLRFKEEDTIVVDGIADRVQEEPSDSEYPVVYIPTNIP